jgi:hypothetical protein
VPAASVVAGIAAGDILPVLGHEVATRSMSGEVTSTAPGLPWSSP